MTDRRLRGLGTSLLPGGMPLGGTPILLHAPIFSLSVRPISTLLPTLTYIFSLLLGWSMDRARTLVVMRSLSQPTGPQSRRPWRIGRRLRRDNYVWARRHPPPNQFIRRCGYGRSRIVVSPSGPVMDDRTGPPN